MSSREYQHRWRQEHPEKIVEYRLRYRSTVSKSTLRGYHLRHRLKKYGLTHEQFGRMLMAQRGCCAGCETSITSRSYIDHDHVTGKVRGLLCLRCNRALGLVQDKPVTLLRLAAYLEGGTYNATAIAGGKVDAQGNI